MFFLQFSQINGVGQHFYSAVPSFAGPGPGPHFHTIPGGHLQPQTMHSQHSPSPPNTYHKDERTQRQHTKLVRKLDQKQREMSKYNICFNSKSKKQNKLFKLMTSECQQATTTKP